MTSSSATTSSRTCAPRTTTSPARATSSTRHGRLRACRADADPARTARPTRSSSAAARRRLGADLPAHAGNDFQTQSVFLNDKWRLNNNFSFNVGVPLRQEPWRQRLGSETAKDSNVSPRIGVTYDPKGDSSWQFNASYAKYVAGISNTQGDASAAGGQPASISYLYDGRPADQHRPTATHQRRRPDPGQAITAVFHWFNGLTQAQQNAVLVFANIPGLNLIIMERSSRRTSTSTRSDSARAWATRAASGWTTSTASTRTSTSTRPDNAYGTPQSVPDQFGNNYDLSVETNTSTILKRQYNGVHVSASYRLSDAINLGGNYTWSTLKGNFNGENGGSGPSPGNTLQYPEYKAYAQYNPEGYLTADQRNRLRVFGVWDIFNAKHNRLSVSVMEGYASGTPSPRSASSDQSYVTNPNYVSPPSSVRYYFTSRDAFRWDNLTQTDIAFTYAFVLPALGTDLQFYLEPRMTNVFNEHAATRRATRPSTRPATPPRPGGVQPVHHQADRVPAGRHRRAVHRDGRQLPARLELRAAAHADDLDDARARTSSRARSWCPSASASNRFSNSNPRPRSSRPGPFLSLRSAAVPPDARSEAVPGRERPCVPPWCLCSHRETSEPKRPWRTMLAASPAASGAKQSRANRPEGQTWSPSRSPRFPRGAREPRNDGLSDENALASHRRAPSQLNYNGPQTGIRSPWPGPAAPAARRAAGAPRDNRSSMAGLARGTRAASSKAAWMRARGVRGPERLPRRRTLPDRQGLATWGV